jgi:Zn-dependent protease with chaperone function
VNATFNGKYFDGETLQSRAVIVAVTAGRLSVTGVEPPVECSLSEIRASDRLGRVPRFLYLPERRTIETEENDAVDEMLAFQQRGRPAAFVHWLESRARVAAIATVTLVVSVAAIIYFGLPVLARRAAMAVPASIEKNAGEAALAAFNRYTQPSQLSHADRVRVERLLDFLALKQRLTYHPRVEFRSLGANVPNAFALPGGIIIMSDQLVRLAEDDEEIMAVLAHELGHVERRHGMQGVLRGSAALLVVSTVTGDLSTLTSFSGTIPFMLLQRGYSREFEAEADDYAIATLHTVGVDPRFFISILEKLEKARPVVGQDYSYLSTHPNTSDRIEKLRRARGGP